MEDVGLIGQSCVIVILGIAYYSVLMDYGFLQLVKVSSWTAPVSQTVSRTRSVILSRLSPLLSLLQGFH